MAIQKEVVGPIGTQEAPVVKQTSCRFSISPSSSWEQVYLQTSVGFEWPLHTKMQCCFGPLRCCERLKGQIHGKVEKTWRLGNLKLHDCKTERIIRGAAISLGTLSKNWIRQCSNTDSDLETCLTPGNSSQLTCSGCGVWRTAHLPCWYLGNEQKISDYTKSSLQLDYLTRYAMHATRAKLNESFYSSALCAVWVQKGLHMANVYDVPSPLACC